MLKTTYTSRWCFFCTILLVSAALLWPAAIMAEETLVIGNFSGADPENKIPGQWELLTFKDIDRKTTYELVEKDGTTVLMARSDNSASGLIRKKRIDPEAFPIIQWRWKATGTYEKGNVSRKAGDDYPARIYITFEYDPERVGFFEKAKFNAIKMIYGEYPPIAAINYIWASKAPTGTTVPNPFTDRTMMIVVESGEERLGTWVEESRNIYEDYLSAFGEKPPMISGIAIMTDSDNTGESTVTYYGDIVMKSSR